MRSIPICFQLLLGTGKALQLDDQTFFSSSDIAAPGRYTGADPEIFCEGGQREGALIIMVWAWLRNTARKRGRCTRGLGLRPSRFLLLSCQRDIRHRPL